jgi:pSer/pThr/pTyr-binding forkhead associated (FHA) protein
MEAGLVSTPMVPTHPINAFLIINGNEIFSLKPGVTNLGRRADNQIIIQDPRVSRQHAQLRSVRNHFVLFDLSSSGGTYVNGQRISQIALKPGDVISLAGVTLIYGEDSPPTGHTTGKTPTADLKPLP